MKKRNSKNKTTIYLAIGVAIIMLIYYFKDSIISLFKGGSPFDSENSSSSSNGEDGDRTLSEYSVENTNPSPSDPDLYVILSKSHANHPAIEKLQQRLNTIIALARTHKKPVDGFDGIDRVKQIYINKIAALTGLKTDGVFGDKTSDVHYTIMNKRSGSLHSAREKYTYLKGYWNE